MLTSVIPGTDTLQLLFRAPRSPIIIQLTDLNHPLQKVE